MQATVAVLEMEAICIDPQEIRLYEDEEAAPVGSLGRVVSLSLREEAPRRLWKGTAIQTMVLLPRNEMEPWEWTRLAAEVILGIR